MGCTVSSPSQHAARVKIGHNDPWVIVGPVVGAVSTHSARILLEVDTDCEITPKCVPEPEATPESFDLKAGAPVTITLTGLTPDQGYVVTFAGAKPQPTATAARFTTQPVEAPRAVRIAAVSCNKVLWDRDGATDVWAHLANRCAAGDFDLVLHLGDQVYGDSDHVLHDADGNRVADGTDPDRAGLDKMKDEEKQASAYMQGLQLIAGLPSDEWWSHSKAIRELYRDIYRQTWSKNATATVLCSQMNAMVLDDHEIVDDWGDTDEDKSVGKGPPYTARTFVALQAYGVYREYQMSLRENVSPLALGPSSAPSDGLGPPAFSMFSVNQHVGVAMLDIRACHSFHADGSEQKRPYLGDEQVRLRRCMACSNADGPQLLTRSD